jgi:hypothetical protein
VRFRAVQADAPAGRRDVGARARDDQHRALDPNAILQLRFPRGFGSAKLSAASTKRANKFIGGFIWAGVLCGRLDRRSCAHDGCLGGHRCSEDHAARWLLAGRLFISDHDIVGARNREIQTYPILLRGRLAFTDEPLTSALCCAPVRHRAMFNSRRPPARFFVKIGDVLEEQSKGRPAWPDAREGFQEEL